MASFLHLMEVGLFLGLPTVQSVFPKCSLLKGCLKQFPSSERKQKSKLTHAQKSNSQNLIKSIVLIPFYLLIF